MTPHLNCLKDEGSQHMDEKYEKLSSNTPSYLELCLLVPNINNDSLDPTGNVYLIILRQPEVSRKSLEKGIGSFIGP